MLMYGKKNWFFPDAELPPPGDQEPFGHESIIVLNPNETPAQIEIRLYFELPDSAPAPILHRVEAGCVLCLRTSDRTAMNGFVPEVGRQYAISVHSDTPVVAQYGRLDVRQENMAFYTTPGYAE